MRQTPKLLLAAGALLLAAGIIDTVLWAVACHRLAGEAHAAVEAAGWTLSAGPERWGGWPDAAEITFPDAALRSGPDILPPLEWRAARQVLRLSAWRPTLVTAAASGAQTLSIGAAAPLPFTAQSLITTIDLTQHEPLGITTAGLEAQTPAGPARLAAGNFQLMPDGLTADLTGLALPDAPPLEALRFDARIAPPVPPRPTAIESARAWRASNGRLVLSDAALRSGPLAATGHATLTLDAALQPVVTGQVSATGLMATVDALAQAGTITRSAASAANGMLAILSFPAGGGPVTLPITIQGGVVTIARIPLLRLPPLRWPNP